MEFLKYEIFNKESIAFSKALVQNSKKEYGLLLSKIAKLKQDIYSEEKFDECNKAKNKLEKIYDNIADNVKTRSKCSWCQYSKKICKIFYGLEKRIALCGTIKTLDHGHCIWNQLNIEKLL